MSNDVSVAQGSLRDALEQLQRKTKLLEEERDYYVHIGLVTQKVFLQHREDVERLMAKERDSAAQHELILRRETQGIESDCVEIKRQIDEVHSEIRRLRAACDAAYVAPSATELDLRRHRDEAELDLERVRTTVATLTGDERGLKAELRRLHDCGRSLKSRASRRIDTIESRHVSPRKKPFVPAGPVDDSMTKPSTHNVGAVVQTIAHHNILRPTTPHLPRGTVVKALMDALGNELISLRCEYAELSDMLGLPRTDTVDVSRRMRALFELMTSKKDELRRLRSAEWQRLEDTRFRAMLKDIANRNSSLEAKYGELMTLLRGES